MIARTWHGLALRHAADSYAAHLHDAVLPTLESLAGFRGLYLLRRETDEGTEFGVISLWESMAAIQSFAGASPERAVVAPEARALLHRFDEQAKHHEVVIRSTGES